MRRILILEDDQALRMGLEYLLKKEGFSVNFASCLGEVPENLEETADLAIFDISLPDGDSRNYVKKLRNKSKIPVVFLTAKVTEEDMIEGFDSGGDDFITKPFSFPVLIRRIRALLNRSLNEEDERYYCGDLVYDFKKKELFRRGQAVSLSKKELRLLEVFLTNRNQILTFETLLEKIWDIDGNFVDKNTLNVTISRLRAKIEEDKKNPQRICNVFGIGYKWSDTNGGL